MPDSASDIQSYYEGHSFLAKSPASPEIVASIMNDKYAKALPLYRIEQSYKNYGAHLSRQTMSNWVLMASRTYLKPIYDKMVFNLLESEVIHADETPVQVLHHQDGSENIQSYMWLYKNRVHPF